MDDFTLSADGVLSKAATSTLDAVLTLTAVVEADDGDADSAPATLTLEITALPALTAEAVAVSATVLPLYTGVVASVSVSGGDGGAYTLSLAAGAADFSLNAAGELLKTSENTLSVEMTLTASVVADDGSDLTAPVTVEVVVAFRYPPFEIGKTLLTVTVLKGETDSGYTLSVSGYAPYSYTLLGTSPAESDVTLQADGGVVLSPLLATGVVVATLEASDSAVPIRRGTVELHVRIVEVSIIIVGGLIGQNNDYNYSEVIWSSVDGDTWMSLSVFPAGPRSAHAMLTHNGWMYLIGGSAKGDPQYVHSFQNDVWRSSNGFEWELVTPSAEFPGRYNHRAVALNGTMYVMGGRAFNPEEGSPQGDQAGDVWSSVDGKSWTMQLAFNTTLTSEDDEGNVNFQLTRERFGLATLNGTMFVNGGQGRLSSDNYQAFVWASSDGANWTNVGSTQYGRSNMTQMFSRDGVLHVVGRPRLYEEDIPDDYASWGTSSDGGKTWSAEVEVTGMEPHAGAAAQWNGKMFIFGTDTQLYSGYEDVWVNADGTGWAKIETDAPRWGNLTYMAAAVREE